MIRNCHRDLLRPDHAADSAPPENASKVSTSNPSHGGCQEIPHSGLVAL